MRRKLVLSILVVALGDVIDVGKVDAWDLGAVEFRGLGFGTSECQGARYLPTSGLVCMVMATQERIVSPKLPDLSIMRVVHRFTSPGWFRKLFPNLHFVVCNIILSSWASPKYLI